MLTLRSYPGRGIPDASNSSNTDHRGGYPGYPTFVCWLADDVQGNLVKVMVGVPSIVSGNRAFLLNGGPALEAPPTSTISQAIRKCCCSRRSCSLRDLFRALAVHGRRPVAAARSVREGWLICEAQSPTKLSSLFRLPIRLCGRACQNPRHVGDRAALQSLRPRPRRSSSVPTRQEALRSPLYSFQRIVRDCEAEARRDSPSGRRCSRPCPEKNTVYLAAYAEPFPAS